MGMTVHFESLTDTGDESFGVSGETVACQSGLIVQTENFGFVAGLNVVAGRLTGVGGDYAKVGAADGSNGATVRVVGGELMADHVFLWSCGMRGWATRGAGEGAKERHVGDGCRGLGCDVVVIMLRTKKVLRWRCRSLASRVSSWLKWVKAAQSSAPHISLSSLT